jgi:hypothetical protein
VFRILRTTVLANGQGVAAGRCPVLVDEVGESAAEQALVHPGEVGRQA